MARFPYDLDDDEFLEFIYQLRAYMRAHDKLSSYERRQERAQGDPYYRDNPIKTRRKNRMTYMPIRRPR